MKRSLYFEFDSAAALARAARQLSGRDDLEVDAHTPYSTPDVRDALDLPPSPLPKIVFLGFCFGAAVAYWLEWVTTAALYPLNVGGRPPHMPLAFVPISFEMGVLAAALSAVIGVLVAGKLVKLWDPVFEVPGIESASVDRFWLRVSGRRALQVESVEAELLPLGALRHVLVEES